MPKITCLECSHIINIKANSKSGRTKCVKCKKDVVYDPERHREYRKRIRDPEICKIYKKRVRAKLRKQILDKLGRKCVRCGFSDERALQIDHINGGGHSERNNFGTQKMYRKIRDMPLEEVKKEYQILCANCNWIKRVENDEGLGCEC